jgi:hypothetical protein
MDEKPAWNPTWHGFPGFMLSPQLREDMGLTYIQEIMTLDLLCLIVWKGPHE